MPISTPFLAGSSVALPLPYRNSSKYRDFPYGSSSKYRDFPYRNLLKYRNFHYTILLHAEGLREYNDDRSSSKYRNIPYRSSSKYRNILYTILLHAEGLREYNDKQFKVMFIQKVGQSMSTTVPLNLLELIPCFANLSLEAMEWLLIDAQ